MLLDTSAWIEYFKETELGLKVKKFIEEKPVVYTCPITLAEISNWVYKNNEEPFPYIFKIKEISKIIELDEDMLVNAGKIYYQERIQKKNEKIGMIDCIIYSCANFHGLKLLTKDGDFGALSDVELLKE
ncbi:MAG: PIN domain-containing protein [Candidatus Micrarchaeota archaeon]